MSKVTVLAGTWLNREKAVFLVAATALAGVGWHMVTSRPQCGALGEHRIAREAPASVAVSLEAPGDIRSFLSGARADPFKRHEESLLTETGPVGGKKKVVVHSVDKLPEPGGGDVKSGEKTSRPVPVPVNFVAVLRMGDGALCVGLRAKKTGESRRLVEGDVWPEIDLRILRIGMSSVLLENAKGERFVMRDLYGRRTAGGGESIVAVAGNGGE